MSGSLRRTSPVGSEYGRTSVFDYDRDCFVCSDYDLLETDASVDRRTGPLRRKGTRFLLFCMAPEGDRALPSGKVYCCRQIALLWYALSSGCFLWCQLHYLESVGGWCVDGYLQCYGSRLAVCLDDFPSYLSAWGFFALSPSVGAPAGVAPLWIVTGKREP